MPGRIALSAEERDELRDVLGNVVGFVGGKKTGGGGGGGSGGGVTGSNGGGGTGVSGSAGGGGGAGGTNGAGPLLGGGMGAGLEDVRALLMEQEDSDESDDSGSGNMSEVEDDHDGEDGSIDGSEFGSRAGGGAKRKASQTSLAKQNQNQSQILGAEDTLMPDFDTPLGFIMQATLEEQADRDGYFQSSSFLLSFP